MAEQMDRVIVHQAQQGDPKSKRDSVDETKPALHGKRSGEDAVRERNQAQEY